MKHYVAGFAYTDRDELILIRKIKPEWQKGKCNGVGGACNELEDEREAMVREWKEETGFDSEVDDWREVVELWGDDWIVHFFDSPMKHYPSAQVPKFNDIGEKFEKVNSYELRVDDVIYNLMWIVPLCENINTAWLPIQVRNRVR